MTTNYLRQLAHQLQPKVIFLPKKLPQDFHFQFDIPFQEYFFETKNEGKLNALYFTTENPKGVILYFHGNADNLIRWGKIAAQFTQYQYNVLVMDYRNYGKSTGKFSEENMYNDAQFCYNWVKNHFPENQIIVYGRSLGGAFATKIAAENTPKMLILECTFYNIENMANRMLPTFITQRVRNLVPFHFQTNLYMPKVKCKIIQFHGTNDWVVPYYSGIHLFKEISHSQKRFITLNKASHNNIARFAIYHKEIQAVLK